MNAARRCRIAYHSATNRRRCLSRLAPDPTMILFSGGQVRNSGVNLETSSTRKVNLLSLPAGGAEELEAGLIPVSIPDFVFSVLCGSAPGVKLTHAGAIRGIEPGDLRVVSRGGQM